MSTIKSSSENLTLNADGSGNDIKFQSNGVEKASLSDGGVFTATSFAGSGANLTNIPATDISGKLNLSGGTMTGNLVFGDNVKATFGAGADLEIYHQGTYTYIHEKGTGELYLRGTNIVIKSDTDNDDMAKFIENGASELYHSNAKKFETTTTGVDISHTSAGTKIRALCATNTNPSVAIELIRGTSGTFAGDAYTDFRIENVDGGHLAISTGESSTTTERMRITDTGTVNIGTGTPHFGTSMLRIMQSGSEPFMELNMTGTGSMGAVKYENGNGTAGSISMFANSVSFNTSSDYRLKENVDYTWDATTRLKQLKPARFNFISDDTNTLVDGFIAHEVSSVVPEAIFGTKDAMRDETDEEGNVTSVPDMQGIDQSKLVPLLVKTIQELEARITALEA